MKTNRNRKFIAVLGMAAVVLWSPSLSHAAGYPYSDTFTLPDGTSIGSSWSELLGDWSILSGQLKGPVSEPHPFMEAAFVESGPLVHDFRMTAQVTANNPFFYVGVAFRIADTNNFYWLRWFATATTPVFPDLVKVVGGVITGVGHTDVSSTGVVTMTTGVPIDITVEGTTLGVYKWTVTDGTFSYTGTASDASLSGGYVGFAAQSAGSLGAQVSYDNFTLIPEPTTGVFLLMGLGCLPGMVRRLRGV